MVIFVMETSASLEYSGWAQFHSLDSGHACGMSELPGFIQGSASTDALA